MLKYLVLFMETKPNLDAAPCIRRDAYFLTEQWKLSFREPAAG